jgi:catechol 2,3-dioxygenase-like lactoylglutathione lyase family enzyme
LKFKMYHNNFNVLDLERSLKFYEEALGLKVVREIDDPEGSYKLRFLANDQSDHQLELTWLRDRKEPYNLGDNEFHLAFETDDYDYIISCIHMRSEYWFFLASQNRSGFRCEPAKGFTFCIDNIPFSFYFVRLCNECLHRIHPPTRAFHPTQVLLSS